MKILFPYKGNSVGGSFKSSSILVKGLREKGYEPIIALHERGEVEIYLNNEEPNLNYLLLDLPVRSLFYFSYSFKGIFFFIKNMLLYFMYSLKLSRYLIKNNIDIVHTNDPVTHFSWLLACFFSRKPHVLHVRTAGLPKIIIKFIRWGVRPRIIVVSKFVKKKLIESKLDVSDVNVIYNPFVFPDTISKEQAKRKLFEKFGFDEDSFVVGCFGNFIKRKHPDVFAEVFCELKKLKPDCKIVFIWIGQLKEKELLAKVKKSVKRHINISFFICDFMPDIDYVIAGCDMVFNPARDEPYGRTFIEAMLLKTPIVAFDSGGNKEIIKDGFNGILCNYLDIQESLNAIIKIMIEEEFVKRITDEGYSFAQKRHHRNGHTMKIEEVYHKLLE